jgi:hypothetical protein
MLPKQSHNTQLQSLNTITHLNNLAETTHPTIKNSVRASLLCAVREYSSTASEPRNRYVSTNEDQKSQLLCRKPIKKLKFLQGDNSYLFKKLRSSDTHKFPTNTKRRSVFLENFKQNAPIGGGVAKLDFLKRLAAGKNSNKKKRQLKIRQIMGKENVINAFPASHIPLEIKEFDSEPIKMELISEDNLLKPASMAIELDQTQLQTDCCSPDESAQDLAMSTPQNYIYASSNSDTYESEEKINNNSLLQGEQNIDGISPLKQNMPLLSIHNSKELPMLLSEISDPLPEMAEELEIAQEPKKRGRKKGTVSKKTKRRLNREKKAKDSENSSSDPVDVDETEAEVEKAVPVVKKPIRKIEVSPAVKKPISEGFIEALELSPPQSAKLSHMINSPMTISLNTDTKIPVSNSEEAMICIEATVPGTLMQNKPAEFVRMEDITPEFIKVGSAYQTTIPAFTFNTNETTNTLDRLSSIKCKWSPDLVPREKLNNFFSRATKAMNVGALNEEKALKFLLESKYNCDLAINTITEVLSRPLKYKLRGNNKDQDLQNMKKTY